MLGFPNGVVGCAQCGAKLVAARTPDQCAAGCGGCQRRAPTGGAAYGMPRNSLMVPVDVPRRAPSGVWTTGPPAAVAGAPVAPNSVASTTAATTQNRLIR